MTSGAAGRANIIDELTSEDEFKPYKLWYEEYKPAFTRYLSTQDFDSSFLALKKNLQKREAPNDHAEQKINKVLEAIELTSNMEVFQKTPEASFQKLPKSLRSINIGGLAVITGATNIALRQENEQTSVGLVYPYLKSSKPLNIEMMKIHGALLLWVSEENLKEFGKANPNLCLVVDLFNSKTQQAPSSYKKIRSEIEANCVEIKERLVSRSVETTSLQPAASLDNVTAKLVG